jgi:hypothetical protein
MRVVEAAGRAGSPDRAGPPGRAGCPDRGGSWDRAGSADARRGAVTAWSQSRGRGGGLLAAALARAEALLLDPPSPRAPAPPPVPPPRPVVAVRGLARGCGTSTVARALAAALARGDPGGAAVLLGGPSGTGPRIAGPAAIRVAQALSVAGCDHVRASGRVCLVGEGEPLTTVASAADCPVVVDVSHASPPAEGLGQADLVVLVASPAVEVALVAAVEASLITAGRRVEVVLNRVDAADPSGEQPASAHAAEASRLEIGESRLAAQLALACREPRGPFARPIAELADRCRVAASG